MIGYGLAFAAGLLVGWNVLPQPATVKRFYDWAGGKIKGWFSGS